MYKCPKLTEPAEPIKTLLESVKWLCPSIAPKELDYLGSGAKIIRLEEKHFFIQANVIQHEIGFVYSGLLRGFYINQEGNEVTVRFAPQMEYATHYTSFITQKPSKFYFQCIEPSVIVTLSYEHIQSAYSKHPGLERYGRLVAEEVLKFQQRRVESFLFDNAETRYLDFIKQYPDLFNRISLSHLSTYLGIERPSLSRIRKNLTSKHL
jgi:CRP/FNR family transcriptional regulator